MLLLLLLCAFRLKTDPGGECAVVSLFAFCAPSACCCCCCCACVMHSPVLCLFYDQYFRRRVFFIRFSVALVPVFYFSSFCVVSGIYQSVLCTMLLQCDRTKSLTPEYSRFGAMILVLLLHLRHRCCSVAAFLRDAAVDVDCCCFIASIFMSCCCCSLYNAAAM